MNKLVSNQQFLKDVLICSLGAYGGPEAHYGVFTDQMVIKKQYLTEEEMIELIALTGILPGPSSTQTIISIGYKIGGPKLAILTLLVWAVPAILIMTLLSFLYVLLNNFNIAAHVLRYIGPMAVGFIVVASYRIGKKVVKDALTVMLFLFGAVTTFFIRESWIFPTVLVLGGVTSVLASKEKNIWNHVKLNPPWKYFFMFVFIGLLTIILSMVFSHQLLTIFESFYRYGYLVIGGGEVVIPYMITDLVEINNYMTTQEFLTGFGMVQGIPGPMFSFAAYAGGMALNNSHVVMQVSGALTAGIAIFLPGTLLILFVYPIWQNLKQIKGIKLSIKGVSAVAGGLIAVTAIIIMRSSGFQLDNLLVALSTIIILLSKKISAPWIVLAVILLGLII